MECRVGCGACCIAPSISSPIPGMPNGKAAGERCIQLTEENKCRLFGKVERPLVCRGLNASEEMCGTSSEEAMNYLTFMENETKARNIISDLHMHSYYTDGTSSPKELVRLAKKNNLSVIALTDHDTVKGLEELQQEAKLQNITAIPAVELSTSVNGIRIHILGYYIDINNNRFKEYISNMAFDRTDKTRQMLNSLNKLGILDYTWDRVLQHNKGKDWLCSLHVFEAMRMDGYYSDRSQWKEFYHNYFSKNSPVYMNLGSFTAKSAVEIILEADGIPVVAHPKLIGDDSQIDALIKAGLRGIEVFYPAHNAAEKERYLALAKKHNLIVTGGSDWHGDFSEYNVQIGEYGLDEYYTKQMLNRVNSLKSCSK